MRPGLVPILFSGAYCPEARELFARTNYPSWIERLLAPAIAQSVADGIWPNVAGTTGLLQQFFLPCLAQAATDNATALTNLVSPNYAGVAINAPTLTPNQGYTGVVGSYIDSMFNPVMAAGQFAQDSETHFGWSGTSGQKNGSMVGQVGPSRKIEAYPRYTDDKTYVESNTTTEDSVSNSSGSGLFLVSRVASGAFTVDRNGTQLASFSRASTAVLDADIAYLLSYDGSNTYTGLVKGMGAGGGFSVAQRASFFATWSPVVSAITGSAT